ncbi:C-terminal helicase domain-containing protein [Paenibacillus aurantius]|uniref:C-terminal helicase domain-containing protein n=1 Tax=Paenibacillus aurantius TaxID=2918900 RepID=A0AA96RCU7_9BACL|nr:C-terminal helicase domain-containing protein [Paenibacillus aurantius]WNQ09087.1 C-terminal helicase domain-containing protein [Paenibacillus aurantius]
MKVTENPIVVSLEPGLETDYHQLMKEYFSASERNSRASSIEEKKQIMSTKDKMALLCNRNPGKLEALKSIIREVETAKEKLLIVTRSSAVALELLTELKEEENPNRTLHIHGDLSIHQVNQMNDRFTKSPASPVLILTDTVNAGLDLTAANHLVHYDYPIRYSDMMQRNHRVTRQTSHHTEASLYYLMTRDCIDEFEFQECMREKASILGAGTTA